MKSPLELLKETELLLFSLCPTDALKLKAKTIRLLKDLPANKYQQLVHQIAQQRRINENFLTWLRGPYKGPLEIFNKYSLESNCPCEECEENEDHE